MKRKRVFRYLLEQFDKRHNQHNVRELEMAVDAVVQGGSGPSIQFWRDMDIYGLDEAMMHLRQDKDFLQSSLDARDRLEHCVEQLNARYFAIEGGVK